MKIFNRKIFKYKTSERGQVMLLTILILGGAMITASIIAGSLITQSIRQSTLSAESAKAIFAADAGLDFLLYKCEKWLDSDGLPTGCPDATGEFNTCDDVSLAFANGSCYIARYQKDITTGEYIDMSSVGYSNSISRLVARTLYITF